MRLEKLAKAHLVKTIAYCAGMRVMKSHSRDYGELMVEMHKAIGEISSRLQARSPEKSTHKIIS
ncbi:MAG: hypothetical protein DCF25_15100 [Leptolyngbya foveolarum]|uniref:Uncharacterized protein n=1 Tax=Leptolyngbya foveolarum TaxID=47253 RepID=A0A2W4VPS8_9CYAN|nr:MAG: hypothetical protein DCF25_15100 [Leptolyngbya foveolarum]